MAAFWRRRAIPAVLLLVVAAVSGAHTPVDAHSSSIVPLEYTWSNACRRGGINGNVKWCPGPCPRDTVRKNYKITTYRRGQWFKFVYYRNNHSGTLPAGCATLSRRTLCRTRVSPSVARVGKGAVLTGIRCRAASCNRFSLPSACRFRDATHSFPSPRPAVYSRQPPRRHDAA